MRRLMYAPTPAWLVPQLGAPLLWKPLILVRYVVFPLQEETSTIYKQLLSPFQCAVCVYLLLDCQTSIKSIMFLLFFFPCQRCSEKVNQLEIKKKNQQLTKLVGKHQQERSNKTENKDARKKT